MEPSLAPTITSFIIRFVQEQPDDSSAQCRYRGAIRHIQTDEEIAFITWAEAEAFIQKFFPIHCLDGEDGAAVSSASEPRQAKTPTHTGDQHASAK